MLSIDLQNAFEPGHTENNFTVLLLRLIAKADSDNLEKLRQVYPVEVEAVNTYKNGCPYKDSGCTEVDWEEIASWAHSWI
jgi:hypothetical protein